MKVQRYRQGGTEITPTTAVKVDPGGQFYWVRKTTILNPISKYSDVPGRVKIF